MFLSFFPGAVLGFVHDKDSKTNRCFEMKELKVDTLEKAARSGFGVFFTPNGIGSVPKPGGKLLRWDGNVVRLNCCFVDLDKFSKSEQMKRIRALTLPPSLVVESKRGYHVYWMLRSEDSGVENVSLWRRIQDSAAVKLDGDRACKNPSRLMRLPGSLHVKGEPFEVRVIEVNDRVYSLADLEVEFPPAPRAVYVPRSRVEGRRVYLPPVQVLRDGERHGGLCKAAGQAYRGVNSSEWGVVREGLKMWYQMSCVNLKNDWEKEVDGVCDWVEEQERLNGSV